MKAVRQLLRAPKEHNNKDQQPSGLYFQSNPRRYPSFYKIVTYVGKLTKNTIIKVLYAYVPLPRTKEYEVVDSSQNMNEGS